MRTSAALLLVCSLASLSAQADCVVLLHGLARGSGSMEKMASAFNEAGYQVANIDYPSRQHPVEELAPLAVEQGIDACGEANSIHFVGHSLGGILVRYYLEHNALKRLGRVVMLAPPNQGSQVTDALKDNPLYEWLNGPAGEQLGTDEDSLVRKLGPVDYPVGVIAGTRTVNPFLSQLLPNPDDGKVSVPNTRVEGMQDFIALPHSHTFMMYSKEVIEQMLGFIRRGRFSL